MELSQIVTGIHMSLHTFNGLKLILGNNIKSLDY